MDNASKAIIIAAGFFIGVLIFSLFMFFLTNFRTLQESSDLAREARLVSSFNSRFNDYVRYISISGDDYSSNIKGYQVYNLIGLCLETIMDPDCDNQVYLTLEGQGDMKTLESLQNFKDTFYFTERLEDEYKILDIYSDAQGYIYNIKIKAIST